MKNLAEEKTYEERTTPNMIEWVRNHELIKTRDLVLELKDERRKKNLSYNKILKLMEEKGLFLSKSTLSRVFTDGSEEGKFSYDHTLMPIAKVLLDDGFSVAASCDGSDVKMSEYRSRLIKNGFDYEVENRILKKTVKELERIIKDQEVEYQEMLERESIWHQKENDYLMKQIETQDKQIDKLMEMYFQVSHANIALSERIMALKVG